MQLPSREDDPYDVNYSTPAKLAAAGVQFAISSGDEGSEIRNLPYTAGMASAFGLSKGDALKSVTLWPAQIFGVADKMGSIDVGKMANIVVTTATCSRRGPTRSTCSSTAARSRSAPSTPS